MGVQVGYVKGLIQSFDFENRNERVQIIKLNVKYKSYFVVDWKEEYYFGVKRLMFDFQFG